MSIQNELSSDIAVALLARGTEDPERLKEIKDLILKIHDTLRESSRETNRENTHQRRVRQASDR